MSVCNFASSAKFDFYYQSDFDENVSIDSIKSLTVQNRLTKCIL